MEKFKRLSSVLSVLLTACCTVGLLACEAEKPTAALPEALEAKLAPVPETATEAVRQSVIDVLRDEDPYSRARRLGTLLPTLRREDVRVVPELLGDPAYSSFLGGTALELLLRYWATYQPEEATRWAVLDSPPAFRIGAVFASLPIWAESDPEEALVATLQWSQERPDVREAVQLSLVTGWFAAGNPPALQRYIQELGPSITRQRAISAYVRTLITRQGTEAAIRWAEAVPEDDAMFKLAIYRQMAFALAMFDHDAGIRWCNAHCDGPFGKDLRGSIAGSWMRTDPAGALQWLSTQPAGRERDFAVRSNFSQWVRTDRTAALAWMAAETSEGPEEWLRPTIPVYARSIAGSAPNDAILWAERIQDEAKREFVLVQVVRVWRTMDEEAAEAWMLESSLADVALAEVRANIPIGLQQRRKLAAESAAQDAAQDDPPDE